MSWQINLSRGIFVAVAHIKVVCMLKNNHAVEKNIARKSIVI